MTKTIITIDINAISTHAELISHFIPSKNFTNNDHVLVKINLNIFGLLLPDYLLLIACYLKHLKTICALVEIEFIDFKPLSERTQYASRVNFFKNIEYKYEENYSRHDSNGRFTEISCFDKNNSLVLFKSIMTILIKNKINDDLLIALDFCLWEIIDNTINHSERSFTYSGKGYVCAQFYPWKQEIRIIIADSGIGIHSALTSYPGSIYSELNEKEAVLYSVNKGVTNGVGMGFGLWATAELIKENRGQLIIHSGNYILDTNSEDIIQHSSHWQGTYTFLKINTANKINYSGVFNNKEERINQLNDLKEELNNVPKQEINNDLIDLW